MYAAPVVHDFTERLRAGEPALLEEMSVAHRIVMAESVRNAMIAAFQELDMWPPSPSPIGVDEYDCSYEDLSAPIPVIAQRAYNDEVQRRRGAGDLAPPYRRAMTASYLIDFACEVGVKPLDPETQLAMYKEFGAVLEAWVSQQVVAPNFASMVLDGTGGDWEVLDSLSFGVSAGVAAVDGVRAEAAKWWAEHWREALWTLTSAMFIGAAATAGFALVQHTWNSKEVEGSGGSVCDGAAEGASDVVPNAMETNSET